MILPMFWRPAHTVPFFHILASRREVTATVASQIIYATVRKSKKRLIFVS